MRRGVRNGAKKILTNKNQDPEQAHSTNSVSNSIEIPPGERHKHADIDYIPYEARSSASTSKNIADVGAVASLLGKHKARSELGVTVPPPVALNLHDHADIDHIPDEARLSTSTSAIAHVKMPPPIITKHPLVVYRRRTSYLMITPTKPTLKSPSQYPHQIGRSQCPLAHAHPLMVNRRMVRYLLIPIKLMPRLNYMAGGWIYLPA